VTSRPARGVAAAVVLTLVAAGCSDDGGSADDLCVSLTEPGIGRQLQGFDPTDRDAALDALRPARVTLGELHDAAPDEIRDDLQVEIDYVQALIDALEPVSGGDPAEAALRVQSVTNAHPGVDEAAANLAAFADEECQPEG
jgi:hypothetical protein